MIIVCGNSRSGTTMTGRILGGHPAVHTFQELHFFDEVIKSNNISDELPPEQLTKTVARLMATDRQGYFKRKQDKLFYHEAADLMAKENVAKAGAAYKAFIQKESALHQKTIGCEQTPQNLFYLKEIFDIIPDARVVILVRDPRAVLLSQKFKWKRRRFSGNQIPRWESTRAYLNYHPITISKIWQRASIETRNYQNDPRVLVVKYEDIIQTPDLKVKEICSHVGLQFNPRMLEIPITGSSNRMDDGNISKGISGNLTDWSNKLTPTEIALCEETCKSEMEHWGYALSGNSATPVSKLMQKISLPVKLFLSLPFNLHRIQASKHLRLGRKKD